MATIEERLAEVEAQVAQLMRQTAPAVRRPGVTGKTNPQVIEELFGVFANDPHFDRVVQTIEENRARERREAEMEADAAEAS